MGPTDVSRLGYATAPPAAATPDAPTTPPAALPDAAPLASPDRRLCERVLAFVDRHRVKLFIALAALYLLGFNGHWRPEPDSALYLTIGRNLALGDGYTYHGQSHRLVFPGLPWLFAGLFKLFGTDSLVPHHLAMLAMGAMALALTYRLFLLHAGRPMAVLVTLLVGVSTTFYRYNFELLTDLPFMLAVMAFLVGYEGVVHRHCADDPTPTEYPRGKPHALDWALLLLGLVGAVVTRPTMLALLAAAAGAAAWPMLRGRFRWGSIAIFIVVVAAGVAFYKFDPRGGGDYERMLLRPDRLPVIWERAVYHNLPKLFEPTVAEAVFAVDFSDAGNIFLSTVLILTSFSLFRAHALWGLLVVMTGAMLVAVEVHVRYLLFILPLLIYAWFRVLMWLNHRFSRRLGNRLFAVVLVVFVGTNVVRSLDIALEQRWPRPLEKYKGGRYASLPEVAAAVRDKVEPGAWVLVRHKMGRILTFASGRYAVEPDPNGGTELDPSLQPVYVLDPVDSREEAKLDTRTRDWMAAHNVGRGETLATLQGRHDRQPWVLSRAVKLAPPPPAAAPQP